MVTLKSKTHELCFLFQIVLNDHIQSVKHCWIMAFPTVFFRIFRIFERKVPYRWSIDQCTA